MIRGFLLLASAVHTYPPILTPNKPFFNNPAFSPATGRGRERRGWRREGLNRMGVVTTKTYRGGGGGVRYNTR